MPYGGSFAFVMATGIVAMAAAAQGLRLIGTGLFAINCAAFAILSLRLLWHLTRDRAALAGEWSRHRSAAGFLTVVAAIAVLGDEFVVQADAPVVGAALWLAACGLWTGLVYAVLAVLATSAKKPSLAEGLDGSWLLIAVATEALAVLAAQVAGQFARPDIVLWLSLSWFLLGGFFYVVIIALIAYRWLFEALAPEDLTPPYWINMGAMAIATLAGARLQAVAGADPLLRMVLPGIVIATVLFWAVASWWIPLLVVMMIWRHAVRGVPLSYRFEYWSMVFPLGMYTVATSAFVDQGDAYFLSWFPKMFVWAAIGAWAATFAGMVRRALAR
jgi:tellurite resistance protein TehA-like permease